jgi:uncharacterized protein YndB with AHSA1/START domain
MSDHSFTTTSTVDRTPQDAFDAITDPRGWWSEEIDGDTDTVGGEFRYRFEDVHRCTFRVTELDPGRKASWRVVDNYFAFTQDETERTGTTIIFDDLRDGRRDRDPVHPPRPDPRVRVLRRLLQRLGLLRQHQPAEPDHHWCGAAQRPTPPAPSSRRARDPTGSPGDGRPAAPRPKGRDDINIP